MRVPAWVVVALGCAGCAKAEQAPSAISSTASPETPVATASAEPAPSVVTATLAPRGPVPEVTLSADDELYLANSGVTRGDYLRREFYTWTTTAQLNELRSRRRLLIKDRADDGSRAFFDRRLELMRGSSDFALNRVSRRLLEKDLGLRRFAWVNPWGTSRGWGESDTYGHVLVKVRLKPEAMVARLDGNGWEFRDERGVVPVGTALSTDTIKSLAVVYHSWDPKHPGEGMRELEARPAFREFVLVNESMIESWEVDTPAVRDRLERDKRLLGAIAPQVSQPAPSWHTDLAERWDRIEVANDPSADFDQRFASCLAFSSKEYAPDQAAELVKALSETEKNGALDVKVSVPFGAPLVVERKTPRRPPGWRKRILW
ncbi:MAG: hypothetical protein R3B07_18985 [Polyangiaceae bacterium]